MAMKFSAIIDGISSAFGRIIDPPKVEITINHAPSVPNVKMRRVPGSNTIRVDIDFDERNSRPIDVVISGRVATDVSSPRSQDIWIGLGGGGGGGTPDGVEGRGGLGGYCG
jgi:hypothetical protein